MKEILIDIDCMVVEIDASKNGAYIVKDGKVVSLDLPEYGSAELVCVGGKVDRVEYRKSEKLR